MDKASKDLQKTRTMALLRRTEFPENHHYVPDPAWARSAFTVARAGIAVTAPDYRIERAEYPGQDVLFCRSGRGFAVSEGATMAVGPSQLVWLANERPHAHWPDQRDPWVLLWLRLDGPNCAAIRRKLFGDGPTTVTVSDASPIEAWFGRLFRILQNREADIDLALNQLVAEFLNLIGAALPKLGKLPLPRPLETLLRQMQKSPELSWQSTAIVEAIGLSAAQIRRLFHRHLGLSPRQWLVRERIMRSQKLLLESEASISDVATRCGFCDIYHFSREFKRRVGASPRAWRRAEGGGPGAQ